MCNGGVDVDGPLGDDLVDEALGQTRPLHLLVLMLLLRMVVAIAHDGVPFLQYGLSLGCCSYEGQYAVDERE